MMGAYKRASLWGLGGDGLRFLLAGAANTLLAFAAYQLFLFAMGPSPAYALAWVCGLVFVVIVYPSKVFAGARTDATARFRLGLTYAAVFLVGLATLEGLIALGLSPRLAIILVMAVTTFANFFLGRLVLGRRAAPFDRDR
jgi:putative flippase GtrA